MSLTNLQAHVIAYYTTGHGKELSITQRWYPHAELIMILDDKIAVAVRKFGRKAGRETRAAATYFVDWMIERGGWSTQKNDFGGTMHQFQLDKFPALLAQFNAESEAAKAAAAGGETYWADTFAALTA
ncbi:MAG: hypothetical protein ACKOPQ_02470 [Novosphingobium sp.]